MGKVYKSGFYSIDDVGYTITIECATGSGTEELTLSGNPFVTSMDSDDEILYTPIRCSGATIEFYIDSLKLDLYSGSAKGTKVKLVRDSDSKVMWCGYVSPMLYTQDYSQLDNYIEIECVDGIAVLKDLKYLFEADDDKNIHTFAEIIAYCLKQSGCIKEFYITDNVQMLSATSSESVIENMRMSNAGLYDNKDDVTQPDENNAWSCYDVLSEIMRFLGYTLICDGERAIAVDYDAIRKGNNTYFKYTVGGDTLSNPSTVTLSQDFFVDVDDFADTSNAIDLTETYNKAKVSDNFRALETEDGTSGIKNITAGTDPYFNESWIEGKGIGNWYDTCDTIVEEDDFGNNLTYQICVNRLHSENWVFTIVKYYSHPKYTFYRYNKLSPYAPMERVEDGAGYVMNSRGGTYCEYCHIDIDQDDWHASPLYIYRSNLNSMSMTTRRNEWTRLLNSKLANLNFTKCIVMMNGNQGSDGHIGISNWKDTYEYKKANIYDVTQETLIEPYCSYPVFEYNDNNAAIFGSRDGYVVLKGTITTHDEWWNPWPMNNGKDNNSLKYKKKQKCVYGMFCWCKFQWGDQWWTGSNWRDTECFFKLFWYNSISENMGGRTKDNSLIWEEHYAMRYFDKNLSILGINNANYIVGEEGYYINAPTEGNLNGKIRFIMYMPRDIWDLKDERCDRYYTCVQCLSDFQIESSINTGGSLGDDSALDSDTVYSNEVNDNDIKEMEEIEFKVCTFDHKNTSYSVVDYLDENGNSQFVDATYNKANNAGEGGPLRQEQHLIYKLVTQYEEPRIKYTMSVDESRNPLLWGLYSVNDGQMTGKKFIAESIEHDYRMNKASIKLTEKK